MQVSSVPPMPKACPFQAFDMGDFLLRHKSHTYYAHKKKLCSVVFVIKNRLCGVGLRQKMKLYSVVFAIKMELYSKGARY